MIMLVMYAYNCNPYSIKFTVDCMWSQWGGWATCSVTCGGGTQDRSRTIDVLAQNGGTPCGGSDKETQTCNTHCCPQNCQWQAWAVWSACSKTCGGGTQQRSRAILTNEACGGTPCSGTGSESQNCNTQACAGKLGDSEMILLFYFTVVYAMHVDLLDFGFPLPISQY